MDKGDVSLSAEDTPPSNTTSSFPAAPMAVALPPLPVDHSYPSQIEEEKQGEVRVYEEEHHSWFGGSTAVKYLLAGGVAGGGECIVRMTPTTLTRGAQFRGRVLHPLTG